MIKEVFSQQRALTVTGMLFIILLFILAAISIFDTTEIMGINRWIKPMKFASSIAIYLLTLAFYLYFIPGQRFSVRLITWGAIAMMVGEIALITMQAARGTTSHFNNSTAFNSLVFSAMGTMIAINTLFLVYLLVLYFRSGIELPMSVIWGARLGIILLLLASIEGGLMAAILRHSIGVEDGGPGLPFVNWSTRGGDLRAAHFVGMHAFQILPLFAVLLERFAVKRAALLTALFGIFYFGLFSLIFVEAWLGKPLIAMN